jgi:hypothetical protein
MEFVKILSFTFLLFIRYTLVNGSTPKVRATLKVDIAQVLRVENKLKITYVHIASCF